MTTTRHTSFAEFYPYYLSQHGNRMCRRAHFLGSSSAIAAVAQYIDSMNPWWILVAVVTGYGGAWIGHFMYEKNRPASFTQPLYSFRADWVMYWQMLTGKLSW
ncbi:MAG: Mpo1-like protein [Telluria sp.]